MFGKVYGEDRLTVIVRIRLSCEGGGKIELQDYGEACMMSMLTVMGQVLRPWLGLGLGVR